MQKPTPNAPFTTINDTNNAVLKILTELYNIFPKSTEEQSTNRHNGKCWERQEVAGKPDQVITPLTHRYSTRKQQHQKPAPRLQAQKRKPGRPPRVEPIGVTMEKQEKIKTWKTSKSGSK